MKFLETSLRLLATIFCLLFVTSIILIFVNAFNETSNKMNKYYFTFGTGHFDDNHKSLGDFYTTIEGGIEYDARRLMYEKRQDKWSSSYDEKKPWMDDLTYIPFEELTSQSGPTR